jgi:hypothetical protein
MDITLFDTRVEALDLSVEFNPSAMDGWIGRAVADLSAIIWP